MTTPEEHNKYLGYSHLGYASFQLLMMALMAVFFYVVFNNMPAGGGGKNDFPPGVFAFMMSFVFIFQMLFAVPSLFAGYGLLKRKSWAKTASIIAGVLSAMSFPIGTAVCVYTFWFLFSEPGKTLYDKPQTETARRSDYLLNEPADANSVGNWNARKKDYAPPKEMPNWRE